MKSRPTASSHEPARILVVDDHPIVRQGLTQLIQGDPGMQVCGEAGNISEAISIVQSAGPDVVVVDLALGDDDGLELIKALRDRFPSVKVLVFSMREESHYAELALRASARGFIAKSEGTSQVLEGIRKVLDGELYLSPSMSGKVLRTLVPGVAGASVHDRLTDRELQVFEMIGAGLTTSEIATKLHLSVKTIESHRQRIKDKLKLAGAGELLKSAISWRHTRKP